MNLYRAEQERMVEELGSSGADLDRKFWIALALFGILALLAWFIIGAGTFDVDGRAVQIRLVPLVVFGGLALKTVVAWQAEKIRRQGEKNSS